MHYPQLSGGDSTLFYVTLGAKRSVLTQEVESTKTKIYTNPVLQIAMQDFKAFNKMQSEGTSPLMICVQAQICLFEN